MAPTVGIYHAVLIIEKYYIPWVYQHIMAYINVYQCSILYNIYLYIYINTIGTSFMVHNRCSNLGIGIMIPPNFPIEYYWYIPCSHRIAYCYVSFIVHKWQLRHFIYSAYTFHLYYIWLVVSTNPSEKWWSESQLGWWNSQLNGKKTKPPTRYYINDSYHGTYPFLVFHNSMGCSIPRSMG
jgi:hypothetical protein